MRDRRYTIVFLVSLLVCTLALLPNGCRKKEQPAETNSIGNATDRNPASGTSGTGEPASPATSTAASATQLDTIGTSAAGTEKTGTWLEWQAHGQLEIGDDRTNVGERDRSQLHRSGIG